MPRARCSYPPVASRSLDRWNTTRAEELDQIESAHQSVGGSARGRRYATQQIDRAYAVLLSSQFQGFCRDLHSEAVDYLAGPITLPDLRLIFRTCMTDGRKLDSGNPNSGNLGSDFKRLGIDFWDEVKKLDARNADRLKRLDELNIWRNAIAHQHFDPARLGGRTALRLADVQRWRGLCRALAKSFDVAVGAHILVVVGTAPW